MMMMIMIMVVKMVINVYCMDTRLTMCMENTSDKEKRLKSLYTLQYIIAKFHTDQPSPPPEKNPHVLRYKHVVIRVLCLHHH